MFKKSKNGNGSSPLSQIQDFYKFMVDQALETLEYSHEGLHVRMVRRRAAQVHVPVPVMAPGGGFSAAAAAPSASASTPVLPPNALAIKSPMMGVFYRAGTPSSPPFVKNGDSVKKGQVICLIEAMKVFNEVKADFDCVIVETLLDNGKPVKAGQELFRGGAQMTADFGEDLESIAGRALEMIESLPSQDSITAWDLKLKLKVALSPLYMALGLLQERGRIRIAPDALTYRIHPAGASKAAQPIVGIPIRISAPGAEPVSSKTS